NCGRRGTAFGVTLPPHHRIYIYELSVGLRRAHAATPLDHGSGLGGRLCRAIAADLQLFPLSPRLRGRCRGADIGDVREGVAGPRSLSTRCRGLFDLVVLDRASRRDRLSAHTPPTPAASGGTRDRIGFDA